VRLTQPLERGEEDVDSAFVHSNFLNTQNVLSVVRLVLGREHQK
jgi:hypothetical protein